MIKGIPDIIRLAVALLASLFLFQCSAIKDQPKYQLQDDYYLVSQKGQKKVKAFVYLRGDSTIVNDPDTELPMKFKSNLPIFYTQRSLDVDLLTVPFKYRPATSSLPQQLNSNINGQVMVGYRIDRFEEKTPAGPGLRRALKHRGLGAGGFGGFGSTFVSSWTTNNQQTDEYDGLVFTRGLTILVAVNSLTVGIAAGWDFLTGRDKNIWIYQNKPWYGLSIGINLN